MRNSVLSANKLDLRGAADNVVSRHLKVAEGEEVAIIFEQDRLEVAENLTYALLEKNAHPIAFPIFNNSRSILSKVGSQMTIPKSFHSLLDRVSVIITLLEKNVGELDFRRQILKHIENNICRIAHMPGITAQQFAEYLKADIEEIDRRGHLLAEKIEANIGKTLHITSKAGTDLSTTITKNVHLSAGLIDKAGQLGNLPGGEVYFIPEEGSAKGKVVIDVSIPNTVLNGTDLAIMLPITDGKVDFNALEDPRNLISDQLRKKGADVLCEVGIGLNDQIHVATGIALIDEKILGTVHVAFGDNTFFGGSNKSSVHMDMVMKHPSLSINGEQIMDNGNLVHTLM